MSLAVLRAMLCFGVVFVPFRCNSAVLVRFWFWFIVLLSNDCTSIIFGTSTSPVYLVLLLYLYLSSLFFFSLQYSSCVHEPRPCFWFFVLLHDPFIHFFSHSAASFAPYHESRALMRTQPSFHYLTRIAYRHPIISNFFSSPCLA